MAEVKLKKKITLRRKQEEAALHFWRQTQGQPLLDLRH